MNEPLSIDYNQHGLVVVEQCLVCLDVFTLDELLIDTVEFGEDDPVMVVAVCEYCATS